MNNKPGMKLKSLIVIVALSTAAWLLIGLIVWLINQVSG